MLASLQCYVTFRSDSWEGIHRCCCRLLVREDVYHPIFSFKHILSHLLGCSIQAVSCCRLVAVKSAATVCDMMMMARKRLTPLWRPLLLRLCKVVCRLTVTKTIDLQLPSIEWPITPLWRNQRDQPKLLCFNGHRP